MGNVRLNLLKNSRQKIILSDIISTRKLLVHLRKILPSRNIIWQNYFLVEIFSYFFGFAIDNFLVFRDEQMLLIVASYLFCKVKLEIHAFQWSRRAFIVKLFISEYRIVFSYENFLDMTSFWRFSLTLFFNVVFLPWRTTYPIRRGIIFSRLEVLCL